MADKLSDEKINQLREYYFGGIKSNQAAKKIGISHNTAWNYYKGFENEEERERREMPDKLSDEKISELRDCFRGEGLTQPPPEMQPEPAQEAHEFDAEIEAEEKRAIAKVESWKSVESPSPVYFYLDDAMDILGKMPLREFKKYCSSTQKAILEILSINEAQEAAA